MRRRRRADADADADADAHKAGVGSAVEMLPDADAQIEALETLVATSEREIVRVLYDDGAHVNPYWGYLSRAGIEDKSHLMRQIEKVQPDIPPPPPPLHLTLPLSNTCTPPPRRSTLPIQPPTKKKKDKSHLMRQIEKVPTSPPPPPPPLAPHLAPFKHSHPTTTSFHLAHSTPHHYCHHFSPPLTTTTT